MCPCVDISRAGPKSTTVVRKLRSAGGRQLPPFHRSSCVNLTAANLRRCRDWALQCGFTVPHNVDKNGSMKKLVPHRWGKRCWA